MLAGPTATRTLAEFGADVVKINNPGEEGAGYRWQVHRYHTDVNRGKRTILLDLKQPDGLGAFRRLVEGADVVLHNFRPGVAERLGVGYEQVRLIKPDIVYGSVGFCGEGGPWEGVPGYEPNAQAATGMMARMAGKAGPPAMQPFAPNDYATGLLGAFALGLALFHRGQTGQGAASPHVAGRGGNLAPGDCICRPTTARPGTSRAGRMRSDGARSSGSTGHPTAGSSSAPSMPTSRGWTRCPASRPSRACAAAGLEAALAARFATSPAAEWVSRLTAAGIGAQPVISATQLMQDPWVIAHGLSVTREHGKRRAHHDDRAARTTVAHARHSRPAGLGAGRRRRGDPRGHRPGASTR